MTIIDIGDKASDFSLSVVGGEYEENTLLSLGDIKKKRIVFYFYPRDLTPGCTRQGCDLRDSWKSLPSDVEIFGISTDSIEKHKRFIEKYQFPHPLISDPDGELAKAYGVWKEKNLYGKKFKGVERSTFVINQDHCISHILRKVNPKKHILELLQILQNQV